MLESNFVAGCVCTIIAGILLAVQSGVNLTLGLNTGRSFASVVSFATGLFVLIIFFLVDVYGLHNRGPDAQAVKGAPWWCWIGGPMGAFYIASAIIFAPRLGAATLFSIFTTSQLITALVLDTQGWVGYKKRPLHFARILGLLLLLVGVFMITFFGRDEAAAPPPEPTPAASATSAASASNGYNGSEITTSTKHLRGLQLSESVPSLSQDATAESASMSGVSQQATAESQALPRSLAGHQAAATECTGECRATVAEPNDTSAGLDR